MQRSIGQSGIEVNAIGLGTWAVGGVMVDENGTGHSWGHVDDAEAIQAMQWAIDAGVNFFDTSNNYGCGHAERLIGQAVQERRERVVLATKFGYVCQPEMRVITGSDVSETVIRTTLQQSLKNLATDYIDLYQLHVYDLPLDEALQVRDVLETLVSEGQIRAYGWSCNDPERARLFAEGDHCVAIQHHYNLFERTQRTFEVCQAAGVSSIARGPLAMGILTGKYHRDTTMPTDDFRHDWDCKDGRQAQQIDLLTDIQSILTREGHTLPQAALAWLLTYSDGIIPIPGFKSLAQVKDTVGVLDRGLLTDVQMRDLDAILTPEMITIR
ncbi:MAG: aldo/keto reductase [Chloroflexota bacterium]